MIMRSRTPAGDGHIYEYYVDTSHDQDVQEFLAFMTRNKAQPLVVRAQVLENPFSYDSFDLNRLVKALTDERGKFDPEHPEIPCHACTHMYHRHFDTYADMEPVGCKYCDCETFVDPPEEAPESQEKESDG